MRRRDAILATLSALAATLAGRVANAYVPPGDFLLGKIAERRKGMKAVYLKGIRTFIGRAYEGGKQDVAEEMWGTIEGDYRRIQHAPKGDFLEVSDGKKIVTVENGKVGTEDADPRPLDRLLLLNATKDALVEASQKWGVKLEVTSLARLDLGAAGAPGATKVCWLVGAKEGDKDAPALWIDKDRNFPLQLDDPKAKRRIRFDGWGEGIGAGLMPAHVSIWRGDELEQELKISEAKVNPKLAANLFKPDAPVTATPTPTPSATPTPAPSATAKPAATPKPKPTAKPKGKTTKKGKRSGT